MRNKKEICMQANNNLSLITDGMDLSNNKNTTENHQNHEEDQNLPFGSDDNHELLPSGYVCYICETAISVPEFVYDSEEDEYICGNCHQESQDDSEKCYICKQKVQNLIYDPGEDEYICEDCMQMMEELPSDSDEISSASEGYEYICDECMQNNMSEE